MHLNRSDNKIEAEFESIRRLGMRSDRLLNDYSSDNALLFEHDTENDDSDSITKVAEDLMKAYQNRNLCETSEEEH